MTPSTLIKCLWVCGVTLSLYMCYHVMVEKQDFEIVMNEDGIPTLDEE